jgi:hypothetical protein
MLDRPDYALILAQPKFLGQAAISRTLLRPDGLTAVKHALSSTHKKVVIRMLDASIIKGYVDPSRYLGRSVVEILDQSSRLLTVPLEEIKGIFFVREFDGNSQRPERKVFHRRPRLGGLWIRMTFRDKEVLEGIISNSLLDLDSLGFHVTPPDMYSNNLKVFIPRTSLEGLEVLAVISNGTARRPPQPARGAPEVSAQIGLFPPTKPTTP